VSSFNLSDLAALPTPEIIETIDYEALLSARKGAFVALCLSLGIDYTTLNLDSDPGAILLQEATYEEMILRARGNDIARDAYLYFSTGAGLDHLGAFYDVVRASGEQDDRFKTRIILAIQGRSTGGTAPRYRSIALSSSLRVADAVVYRSALDPTVNVAVFATDNNGVADPALLATVAAAVGADDVRMVNDTIAVRSAVVQVVNVTADIWLLPNTTETILDTLETSVPAAWVAESGLGRDLTRAWLTAKLMAGGVQRVSITSPSSDVVVEPYQAVRIGTLTLNLMGRDY
jgi:phage-related baseplate assembly protein